jgi:hypothetical protein
LLLPDDALEFPLVKFDITRIKATDGVPTGGTMMGTKPHKTRLLCLSFVVFAGLVNAANADAAQAPRATEAEAIRFLRQASWGPNRKLILAVQKVGVDGWLKQQLRKRGTKYPNLKFYPESQP